MKASDSIVGAQMEWQCLLLPPDINHVTHGAHTIAGESLSDGSALLLMRKLDSWIERKEWEAIRLFLVFAEYIKLPASAEAFWNSLSLSQTLRLLLSLLAEVLKLLSIRVDFLYSSEIFPPKIVEKSVDQSSQFTSQL